MGFCIGFFFGGGGGGGGVRPKKFGKHCTSASLHSGKNQIRIRG